MKKLIKKSIAIITLIVFCAIPTVHAEKIDNVSLGQELINEEIIEKDGLYITISTFEDKKATNNVSPFSNTYEKSGKKTYTAKNADKETLFSFTIHGTFSVNSGVSASCTKSSYSHSITNNAWELKTATAKRSGNKAIGDGEFVKKLLFVTVETFNANVVLTCDSNGNLS